eukprot:93888-Hanusia_phi.AAC.1
MAGRWRWSWRDARRPIPAAGCASSEPAPRPRSLFCAGAAGWQWVGIRMFADGQVQDLSGPIVPELRNHVPLISVLIKQSRLGTYYSEFSLGTAVESGRAFRA